MGKTFNMVGGGGAGSPDLPIGSRINVTSDIGATITINRGSESHSSVVPASGTVTFTVNQSGTWQLSASKSGEETLTDTVSVLADDTDYPVNASFTKIYGIRKNITYTEPTWTRTDNAVGFTFTASIGNDTVGSSSFDNCYPWSGMVRETINGDVMVKIPKFWFKRYRDGDVEYIKIADRDGQDGFSLHPAFQHNGTTQEYIYVGAYSLSSGYVSKSGVNPLVQVVSTTMRSGATNRGTGYGLYDVSTYSAIQMLILVEIATFNVQAAIGRGIVARGTSDGRVSTGGTDSMTYKTGRASGTDGLTNVVYRGIEGLWGNVWEICDGLNMYNGRYYYCNNQSQYNSTSGTNYTQLSYDTFTSASSGFITKLGLDENYPAIMLADEASGGSSTTYTCDFTRTPSSGGWATLITSGRWSYGDCEGIFDTASCTTGDWNLDSLGTRLLFVPYE